MKTIQLIWVISVLFLTFNLQAQPNGKGNRGGEQGIILGKVIDAGTQTPLDYSTIIVYSAKYCSSFSSIQYRKLEKIPLKVSWNPELFRLINM